MALEYVIYISWAPQTKWKHLFPIHTFKLTLKFGWSRTTDTTRMNNYSSHKCSLKLMFISLVFPVITIYTNTIIENTDNIHSILIIHIDTIHCLYRRQFLPIC